MVNGIVFLGGEGPPPERCRALAEEARTPEGTEPLLAAADSGLLLAERADLRPRWIIGDMDSLGPEGEKLLALQPPERVLKYPPGKDHTDAELALFLLWEKGCTSVWLAGGGGGRTDHLMAIRSLFERDRPPDRWLTAAEDIRCLEAPSELALSIRGPLSVFPLGEGPWEAESTGLRWPLAGLPWEKGFFGLSNEAPGGICLIRALRGRFLVIFRY
ncbi:MAG: thiamine pyrophosphokinase [Treponema sp.]|jgi:thiamine pyrophosphokinase|nr:thiamine pyrophosphokinase [Treponema sp.]